MHLVIEFQEEYKRLDKLCKDIFSSEEGVSEYIRQMEKILLTNKKNVYMLEEEYKNLKHVRWVRNQLAHEVGAMEAGVCTQYDLEYIKAFYIKILHTEDPLSLCRKIMEEERKRATVNKASQRNIRESDKGQSISWLHKIFNKVKEFLLK